jgi:hypothetical protein
MGATGSIGLTGATGLQGPQGEPGTPGAQGIQGPAGSIAAVRTVEGDGTGELCQAVACCNVGEQVIGGGHSAFSGTAQNPVFDVRVSVSAPGSPASCSGSRGWSVQVLNSFKGDSSLTCKAYALCAPVTTP